MSTLAEVLVLNGLKPRHAEHIAAVVAEWHERAAYDVASRHHFHGDDCLCGFSSPRSRSRTEHILDALAAHAKGEAR